MNGSLSAERRRKTILSVVLAFICILYILPVLAVVVNSFKLNTYVKTETFALPTAESFAGWANYIKGVTFGNYPFWKSAFYSLFITLVSTALILLCTSMAAWYIARVDSKLCRGVYYLCVFSMVVPFQMVMFTLSKLADMLKLNTPWGLCFVYLGFGAGLAVFIFTGVVKGIPESLEESAMIDGASVPRIFFQIVIPMSRPILVYTIISSFLTPWTDFVVAKMILNSGVSSDWTVAIGLYNMLQKALVNSYFSRFCAGGVLVAVPISILFVIMQKFYVEGITSGAAKG